jgi:hypothetical protein
MYGGISYGNAAIGAMDEGAAAAGPFPIVHPEFAFATAPGSALPVWVSVREYLRGSVSITRGRQQELDRYQAGRATVVLDNRGRRFDPLYTAGPYYPNVKPMRRMRLRATYAGVTYDLFSGYVDSWDQSYDPPREATVAVSATDGFKVLAAKTLPSSVYAVEVAADHPKAWFRLNDTAGSTTPLDVVTQAAATVFGAPTFGAATLIAQDPGAAASFAGSDYLVLPNSAALGMTSNDFTVEFWTKFTWTSGNAYGLFYQAGPSALSSDIYINSGSVGVGFGVGQSGGYSYGTSATLGDGAPHHVVLTHTGDYMRLYIDGALVSGPNPTYWSTTILGIVQISAAQKVIYNHQNLVGVLDEIALYDTALSATRVAAHNTAGRTPWNGDLTGTRVNRILDVVAWPAAERVVDPGRSTLGTASLAGSALDQMQTIRDSEYGECFILPNGYARFQDRNAAWSDSYAAARATLSDDGADVGYSDLKTDESDQLIRNSVTVARAGGTVQTAADTSSIGEYLTHSYSKTGLLFTTDSEALDQANFLLSRYKSPLFRVTELTVMPQRNPAAWFPVILSLDLAYRVNIERTPQGIGSAIDQDEIIEGVRHEIDVKEWRASYYLSPADVPGALIVDSPVSGIVDTNLVGF